jgi:hypothetical protein
MSRENAKYLNELPDGVASITSMLQRLTSGHDLDHGAATSEAHR